MSSQGPVVTYLSPPMPVNMGDWWFDVATSDHFWIRRRFEVMRRLADDVIRNFTRAAEIGCGNGLLQRDIEDRYGKPVTGFELNEVATLSRNFGHQTALAAALDYVSGDVTILMDGDLQDPPEAIPLFVESYKQGYDVVYAQRVKRKEAWWLRACYYLFYRLLAALSTLQLPLDAGDFGLMSRRVIDEIRKMPEHHRYIRGMRTWVGFRQIGIPIERAVRHAGRTKYSPLRLLKLASDGIFAFSIVPLRAAAILGATATGLSALYAVYSLYVKFWLHSPQGFTALILAITFLSGVNLFFLGIIGEYVGRVYEEAKGRPHYVVRKVTMQSNHSDRATSQSLDANRVLSERHEHD